MLEEEEAAAEGVGLGMARMVLRGAAVGIRGLPADRTRRVAYEQRRCWASGNGIAACTGPSSREGTIPKSRGVYVACPR